MPNFCIGQKVVCIRDAWDAPEELQWPVAGCVYTVRGKSVEPWNVIVPVALWLEEVVNPPCSRLGREPAWNAEDFRPLVDRKTDISVFTRMLDDAPSRTPVLEPYDGPLVFGPKDWVEVDMPPTERV